MLRDVNFLSCCALLQVRADKANFVCACTVCAHRMQAVKSPRTLWALKAALFGVDRLLGRNVLHGVEVGMVHSLLPLNVLCKTRIGVTAGRQHNESALGGISKKLRYTSVMKPLENDLCRLAVLFSGIATDAPHVLGLQAGEPLTGLRGRPYHG